VQTKTILGALTLGTAAAGTAFVVGMRRKTPVVLDAVRCTSRATKPIVLGKAGGRTSPHSVVEHVGRRSGRPYETPVVATEVDGGFAIALPYGARTEWLKNVLAAGGATLRSRGATHHLVAPAVVPIDVVDHRFPAKEQRLHRRYGVRDALVLAVDDDSHIC
jgi:deazaflavin-dependent oxidoreductase (nitroreductase family)